MTRPINIEKQIKRHVIAQSHDFFVVTHPGFESITRDEILQLDPTLTIGEGVRGGVSFSGRLTDLYRANLHLRTATRLLIRIAGFKAANFRQLVRYVAAIPWVRYLPSGALPQFKVTARRSRLIHSQAIAQYMALALEQYWQQSGIPSAHHPDQKLWVRIEDDQVTLSLDSSGSPLYRRGLKIHPGQAPVRETLAAAILMTAGYRTDRPLVDPMCGTGTFALEAALMVKQLPPGFRRDFAFMQWPAFRSRHWQYLKSQAAGDLIHASRPTIVASDIDDRACKTLSQCVADHRLQDAVKVHTGDFFNFDPRWLCEGDDPGLVVLNPPYGLRLTLPEDLHAFYARISEKLKRDFIGWQAAVLIPKPALAARLPGGLSSRTVVHGGRHLQLFVGTIS